MTNIIIIAIDGTCKYLRQTYIIVNLIFCFQSSCTIDVTYFPFDQQTCIMKFGSWTFNGDQVSLALYNNKNFVDLSDYWKSGTWDIIEVPAYLNIYEGNHPTETDITFYIIIRRKTLFYTVNLILPTVLISFLCVLVFYLPAEAGEKVRQYLLYQFSFIFNLSSKASFQNNGVICRR